MTRSSDPGARHRCAPALQGPTLAELFRADEARVAAARAAVAAPPSRPVVSASTPEAPEGSAEPNGAALGPLGAA